MNVEQWEIAQHKQFVDWLERESSPAETARRAYYIEKWRAGRTVVPNPTGQMGFVDVDGIERCQRCNQPLKLTTIQKVNAALYAACYRALRFIEPTWQQRIRMPANEAVFAARALKDAIEKAEQP